MKKITVISLCVLFVFTCLLTGFSLGSPGLWTKYLSHWSILFSFPLLVTLLIGLVLMDDLFELDGSLVITLDKLGLKLQIKNHFIWAFLIVCLVSIVLELVQFFLPQADASLFDPLTIIGGSLLGIVLHIIGSKLLMKRVEFELERWEDNVL
jgi:hypothetical protein